MGNVTDGNIFQLQAMKYN